MRSEVELGEEGEEDRGHVLEVVQGLEGNKIDTPQCKIKCDLTLKYSVLLFFFSSFFFPQLFLRELSGSLNAFSTTAPERAS